MKLEKKNCAIFSNEDETVANLSKSELDLSSLFSKSEYSLSFNSEVLSGVPSNIIIKSCIKYGSKWTACKGILAEYSKKTSVHGVRYMFEVHRPFYEKLYWIIVTVISVYLSAYFTWDTYIRWLETPVTMGFDETLVPINKIPFPTITICPEIKTDINLLDFATISKQFWLEIEENNKFENFTTLTKKQLQRFAATLQICENEVIERFASHIPKDLNVNVAQLLLEMAVELNTTLPFCKWNGRMYKCKKLFKYVITDEGICYQFNGLHAKDIYRDPRFLSYWDNTDNDYNNYDEKVLTKLNEITGNWSLDSGYVGQGFNAYPQRSPLPAPRNGFIGILIGLERDFDYICRNFKQGYKVFLNSPESIPYTMGNYILVPHKEEVLVSIIPEYIISTDNLHDFGPEKRQCYFNDERYLRFFKMYSQVNCHIECLANFTINKCGCAKFWMPKPLGTPICSVAEFNCYIEAADEMDIVLANQTKQNLLDPAVKIMCDCMPSCNSLDYNFEISRTHFYFEKTLQAHREAYDYNDASASRLTIYYNKVHFTAMKRTVMFGLTTLISYFGGIFSLFMGISSLSIIELIYFLSIRLYNNLKKRRNIENKLREQELELKPKYIYSLDL